MRIGVILGVLVMSVALLASRAGAQGFGGGAGGGGGFGGGGGQISEEQAQLFQEMQGNFQQIMENMQAKGIDPQEVGQQMFQQIQDGTFDPDEFQQSLIDKGVLDQAMVNRMQGTTQKLMLSGIRQQLGSTDDEWKVLLPKMQRLVAAMSEVGQMGGGLQSGANGMMRLMGGRSNGPTAKAWKELRAAMAEKQILDAQLAIKLRAWRDAHEQAKKDLVTAQEELRNVLTLRQEAILVGYGIL